MLAVPLPGYRTCNFLYVSFASTAVNGDSVTGMTRVRPRWSLSRLTLEALPGTWYIY
jgi:hypothetical protein